MIQCGHRTHNQTTEKTKTEKTPTQQDLSEKDVFHFICSFIILVACGGNKTNNKISGTWILSFFCVFLPFPSPFAVAFLSLPFSLSAFMSEATYHSMAWLHSFCNFCIWFPFIHFPSAVYIPMKKHERQISHARKFINRILISFWLPLYLVLNFIINCSISKLVFIFSVLS